MRARTYLPALLLALTPLLGHSELEKSELDIKKISRSVAYTLPIYHLNQLPLDAHISTNAFNIFINSLDPSHTYFLQTDIDEFEKESDVLYKQLRKGDISFAHNVFNVLLERIENRMTFIEEQLKIGFDTDKDELFLWDRKDLLTLESVGWLAHRDMTKERANRGESGVSRSRLVSTFSFQRV